MKASRVRTGLVRLTYVHLAEPRAFDESQKPKYSVGMIIKKDDKETIEQIKKNYEEALQAGIEKYGQTFSKKATPLKRQPGTDNGLLVDGDEDDRYSSNADYKNSWVLTAKAATQPQVLAAEKGKRLLTTEEIKDVVYSGCYAKVLFNFYPYNSAKMGIACGLDSVCKFKDGESLGGRVNALDYFSDDLDQSMTDSLGDEDDLL